MEFITLPGAGRGFATWVHDWSPPSYLLFCPCCLSYLAPSINNDGVFLLWVFPHIFFFNSASFFFGIHLWVILDFGYWSLGLVLVFKIWECLELPFCRPFRVTLFASNRDFFFVCIVVLISGFWIAFSRQDTHLTPSFNHLLC
jgi:hypothetical protein